MCEKLFEIPILTWIDKGYNESNQTGRVGGGYARSKPNKTVSVFLFECLKPNQT